MRKMDKNRTKKSDKQIQNSNVEENNMKFELFID